MHLFSLKSCSTSTRPRLRSSLHISVHMVLVDGYVFRVTRIEFTVESFFHSRSQDFNQQDSLKTNEFQVCGMEQKIIFFNI